MIAPSSTPPPTSSSDQNKSHGSSGLGGGAIAGVVVGCVCGMGIILAIAAFLIARHYRSKVRNASYAGSVQNMLPDGRVSRGL